MTVLAAFLILAGLIIFCGPCCAPVPEPVPELSQNSVTEINVGTEINIRTESNIYTEINIKNI